MSIFKTSKTEMKPLTSLLTLLYGPPGAGKTTLTAGIPNALYIDTEKGIDGNFEGKPVLEASTWPEVEAAVNAAVSDDERFKDFEVRVFDSVSRAYSLCRQHVFDTRGWTSELDGGSHGKGYGIIRTEFARVVNPLFATLDRGQGLVFVAHATKVQVEKPTGDITFLEPDIQAKAVKEDLQRMAQLVLCYEAEQTKQGVRHVLYTHNDGYHTAKDRTGRLPVRVELPKASGSPSERASQVFAAVNAAYVGGDA